MKLSLKLSLEKALEAWVYEHRGDEDWIDAYWPENGTVICVSAVENILDALESESKYIEENV